MATIEELKKLHGEEYINGFWNRLGVNLKDIEALRKLAELGEVSCQRHLAMLYNEGDGISKDQRMALEWWEKAAAQGDASSMFNIGVNYLLGEGVDKDTEKGVMWVKKAARYGDDAAKEALIGWGM